MPMFLLYIAATSLIFFAISLLISSVLQSNIDTNGFENRLYNERAAKNEFDLENYQKQIAFKVTIDDKEVIYNEEFYNHARPLAPVRYDLYTNSFFIDHKKITVEQVYGNRIKEQK
jgi:hypothetical protein